MHICMYIIYFRNISFWTGLKDLLMRIYAVGGTNDDVTKCELTKEVVYRDPPVSKNDNNSNNKPDATYNIAVNGSTPKTREAEVKTSWGSIQLSQAFPFPFPKNRLNLPMKNIQLTPWETERILWRQTGGGRSRWGLTGERDRWGLTVGRSRWGLTGERSLSAPTGEKSQPAHHMIRTGPDLKLIVGRIIYCIMIIFTILWFQWWCW